MAYKKCKNKSLKAKKRPKLFLPINFPKFLTFTPTICTYLHKTQQFRIKTPASVKLIPKSFSFVHIEPEEKKKNQPYHIPEQSRKQKQLQCVQVSGCRKGQGRRETHTPGLESPVRLYLDAQLGACYSIQPRLPYL